MTTKTNPWKLNIIDLTYHATEKLDLDIQHATHCVEALTGKAAPAHSEDTLDLNISQLSNSQGFVEEYKDAIKAGKLEEANLALGKILSSQTHQQLLTDNTIVDDIRKELHQDDREADLAYILANTENSRKGYNHAGQEFMRLWEQVQNHADPAAELAAQSNQLRALAGTLMNGFNLSKFLSKYTDYVVPRFAYIETTNHAYPNNIAGNGSDKLQDTAWHLLKDNQSDLGSATRYCKYLSEYHAKPGQNIKLYWGTSQELQADHESYQNMLDSIGNPPSLAGKEIDMYKYWQGI